MMLRALYANDVVSDLDAKPCVADLDARGFCRGYTNPRACMGVALDPLSSGAQRHACNEAYVLKANQHLRADDIWEEFPDSAILRIDIVLFCFFSYIEWLLLS